MLFFYEVIQPPRALQALGSATLPLQQEENEYVLTRERQLQSIDVQVESR
jgi:hypothetical protein